MNMRFPTIEGRCRAFVTLSLVGFVALLGISSNASADEYTGTLKSQWKYSPPRWPVLVL